MNWAILAIGLIIGFVGAAMVFFNAVLVAAETLASNMGYIALGVILLVAGITIALFGWKM